MARGTLDSKGAILQSALGGVRIKNGTGAPKQTGIYVARCDDCHLTLVRGIPRDPWKD